MDPTRPDYDNILPLLSGPSPWRSQSEVVSALARLAKPKMQTDTDDVHVHSISWNRSHTSLPTPEKTCVRT
jgi:hypothetical protein